MSSTTEPDADPNSIHNTTWDVVIRGTGVQQSLVALALSRTKKKILHVDRNDYYGGPDAAFSLQEAASLMKNVNEGSGESGLSFSRAYSLTLSPQILYTRSDLLGVLVSSGVYRQLEFQAMGSWWVYETARNTSEAPSEEEKVAAPTDQRRGSLSRVPSSREDVFADSSLDLKARRSLMSLMKFMATYEDQPERWESHAATPFSDFLSSQFGLAPDLHAPLHAICMSSQLPRNTTTAFALPRIARHLRSTGVFGPGFGAVIPKWGGAAEIAQVACRAGAVGGAVYMLGNDVDRPAENIDDEGSARMLGVHLRNGESIKTRWVVESTAEEPRSRSPTSSKAQMLHSISVVNSALTSLFPVVAEGPPKPAGAVVVFPSGSLHPQGPPDNGKADDIPPVHIIVHSSETGECPAGQCVLYASVLATQGVDYETLDLTIERLLETIDENPEGLRVLYRLRYTRTGLLPSEEHRAHPATTDSEESSSTTNPGTLLETTDEDHILRFPTPSLDLVSDENIVARVKTVWEQIMREDGDAGGSPPDLESFMNFREREEDAAGPNDDDDDE
ncbi:MAG: Rab proteins geranylgeranyltransferase component A [Watsoniomyces obsoletus]|nr:MAG: Rab proteins geranylgeranyltransferase component A [Watsoniomyces obsoletus]